MASILKVDTITGVATAGSIAITGEGNSTTTNLQQGLVKYWINFNATQIPPLLKDSFNHASLTDNGTGDFSFTFTNAMNNASYCIQTTSSRYDSVIADASGFSGTDPTTTAFRTKYFASNESISDGHITCAQVSGDLA
mgnify:CR=1 FL=1